MPQFQSGDRVRAVGEEGGQVGAVRAVYRREIRTLDGIIEAFSYRMTGSSGAAVLDETALEPADEARQDG